VKDGLFESGHVQLHRNRRGWYRMNLDKPNSNEYMSNALKIGMELNPVELLQTPTEQTNDLNALLILTRLLRQVARSRRSWLGEKFHSIPTTVPSIPPESQSMTSSMMNFFSHKLNKTISNVSHSTRSLSRLVYFSMPSMPMPSVPSILTSLPSYASISLTSSTSSSSSSNSSDSSSNSTTESA